MTNSLTAKCSTARDKFGAYLRKEQSSRNAARAALSSCYAFSQQCFDNPKEFLRLREKSKISNSGDNVNRYIPVVRLVFGRDVNGEWQPINPQQTSKYANLLDYADFLKISPSGFDAWLKKGSHEGYLKAAREDEAYQLARGKEDKLARRNDRVAMARNQIESRKKDIFGSNTSLKIDMGAAGAPAVGLRHLAVEVLKDGSVEIIGFNNDDAQIVENGIKRTFEKPHLKKRPWFEKHPLADLLLVIKLSSSIKGTAKVPTYITFKNIASKCEILLCQLGVETGPVLRMTTSRLPKFPTNIPFLITNKIAKYIWLSAKQSESFSIIEGSGKKARPYTPSPNHSKAEQKRIKQLRAVWNQTYAIQFAFDVGKTVADLFTPDKNAARRIDTKRKKPDWKLEVKITPSLLEGWITQENLFPNNERKTVIKLREKEIAFCGWYGSNIVHGQFTCDTGIGSREICMPVKSGKIVRLLESASKMGIEDIKLLVNDELVGFSFSGCLVAFPLLDKLGRFQTGGVKKVPW